METDVSPLISAIVMLAESVLPFVTLAAGVGVAAMAIIQMLKEAFYLRAWYHRWRFKRWAKSHWNDSGCDVTKDVLAIVGGGSEFSLFGQATAEFAQRLRMAMQMTLTNLQDYEALAGALSTPDIVKKIISENAADPTNSTLGRRATAIANRKIDALELSFGHWWRFSLRIAATVLSGSLIAYGLVQENGNWDPVAFVLIVVVGGIVAPVAKDIVSAIEGLRRPTHQ